MSKLPAILYHQKRLAQVKAGLRLFPASQIFSPLTNLSDWRQNQISMRSRNSHPLATTPCSEGSEPVVNVAWTLHVTAGVIVVSGRMPPADASRERLGVLEPRCLGVSPTASSTRVGRMEHHDQGRALILAKRACAVNPSVIFSGRRPLIDVARILE